MPRGHEAWHEVQEETGNQHDGTEECVTNLRAGDVEGRWRIHISCSDDFVLRGAAQLTGFGSAILDAGNGSVVVRAGSTAPFTAGDVGTIDNLNFNMTFPLVGFMVINNLPNRPATIDFDLKVIRTHGSTAIGGCTGTAATMAGDTCTPANSPFQLTNGLVDPLTGLVDIVSVSSTVDAYGYTGSSGTNYNPANLYVGTFTTQQAIQGATIQSILNTIATGGSVSASWSATFTPVSPTPEPGTYLVIGAGLVAIGCFKRNVQRS